MGGRGHKHNDEVHLGERVQVNHTCRGRRGRPNDLGGAKEQGLDGHALAHVFSCYSDPKRRRHPLIGAAPVK